MTVLVTGANGQLGQSLQHINALFKDFKLIFLNSSQLDISNFENCQNIFEQYKPHFCINTAAYTAVDLAEKEHHQANLVNHIGAENLAKVSKIYDTTLIHISTDYVFDGSKTIAYKEHDSTYPLNVYGQTKLLGEKAIANIWYKHIIIRTSWVYSNFGKNFYLSMLNLAKTRNELNIVSDQIGSPTSAIELAKSIFQIIDNIKLNQNFKDFGIYHFTQKGQCSWYDFAQSIFKLNRIHIKVNPIPTSSYPTPTKRPAFSLLDTSKIEKTFGLNILTWEEALRTF